MGKLAEKSLLVNMRISQWAGRRFDRAASVSVEAQYATAGRVGNYNKQLLPNCYELEVIHSITSEMRKFFLAQTLPWLTDGTRIISTANYLAFTQEFAKRKAQYDKAVNTFLSAYPNLVRIAQTKLGNLFNVTDYPSVEQLSGNFSAVIAFYPMPSASDFRIDLGEEAQATFAADMQSIERKAMRECWDRLHKVVSKAAQTLAQPDAVFRDTLLSNMTELCALLPKLNITDDVDLENMRKDVEAALAGRKANELRGSALERKETAQSLNDIMAKMNSIMGGA